MNIIHWLDKRFEETLMMIFLALITIVMAYSVLTRYLFNDALSWAEEMCRYLFVWSTFLSVALCLRKRTSVKIDMLIIALPKPVQRLILILGDLIMLAFFCYVFYGAILTVQRIVKSGQTSPALLLPMYVVYASAVIGFGLSIIRVIQRLFLMLTGKTLCYQSHLEYGKDVIRANTGGVDNDGR